MKWQEFKATVPGKWVLAGEHSVLRGGEAIALPHPNLTLTLHYVPGSESLKVLPEVTGLILHDLIRSAGGWLEERGISFVWPRGILHLESTIPYGAGLGSSAALSVALARWLLAAADRERSEEESIQEQIDFGKFLEDRFHGRSSGMDVTAVVLGEPILFSMEKGAERLRLPRLPEFRFYDSGLRASTKDCVRTVTQAGESSPEFGRRLDREMQVATELALRGLRLYATDERAALQLLQESMRASTKVFLEWGLLPPEVQKKLDEVESSGAIATRVTGAGMGGFIVGLKN